MNTIATATIVPPHVPLPSSGGLRPWPDPLSEDQPTDEIVVTTRRGMVRMALVAAEAAARFQRDGVAHDVMAWMLAPRDLFDGRAAIDACVTRDACLRGAVLHGLSLGLDADPTVVDRLIAIADDDGRDHGSRASREPAGRRPAGRKAAGGPRHDNVLPLKPKVGPAPQLFTAKRIAGDEMMLYVQHLVNLHAIGLIVVDEIQCAMQSPEGVRPLMNFLVGLVNMLGVPLMLIGTNEARPIVDNEFREARRAAGLGQPNWFRMERGEEWDDWLAEVWEHQWMQIPTPMTPQISEAIFDETQGVIDLAVKLIILAQMRAIDRNELTGAPEILDEGLIRKVAKDEFRILAPMIKAMRDGRDEILATYSDLQPFHDHVDRLLCQSTGRTMKELRTLRDLRERVAEAKAAARDAPWLPIKASLLQRGHAEEVVDRVIAEALTVNAVDDVLASWRRCRIC